MIRGKKMSGACMLVQNYSILKGFIFLPHTFQLYQVASGKKTIFSFNFSILPTKHTNGKNNCIFHLSIFLLFQFSFHSTKQSLKETERKLEDTRKRGRTPDRIEGEILNDQNHNTSNNNFF